MKTILLKAVTILAVCISTQTFAQNLDESFEGSFPPSGWTIFSYNYFGLATSWQQTNISSQNGLKSVGIPSGYKDDWFITPKISITTATDSIHFWAKISHSSSLSVDILGSTTGVDTASFINVIDTNFSPTTIWTKYSYGLGNFIGQELYFGFHSNRYNGLSLYVDNFTGPTLFIDPCPAISSVTVYDETHESATFSWGAMADAMTYNYNIVNAGEGSNGTSIASGSVADTFVVVTGLPENSNLEMWINNSCGSAETSEMTGPYTFGTRCDVKTSEYIETFNAPAYFAECWMEAKGEIATSTVFTIQGNSNWRSDGFLNNTFTGAARLNISGINRYDWFISPTLDLDSIANSEISFFAGLTQGSSSQAPSNDNFGDDDKVHVVISTDNGVTWSSDNILITFDTANVPSHLGEFYAVSLSGYSGKVKIGFYGESTAYNEYNDFFLDNFRWGEAIPCLPVDEISIDSTTANDISVSWANAGNSTNVIVEYGETGFTLGSGIELVVSGTSVTLSGLVEYTGYDVYIRSVCTSGDSSVWNMYVNALTDCGVKVEEYLEDFTLFTSLCWEVASGQIANPTVFTSSYSYWQADGFTNVGTSGARRVTISGSNLNSWIFSTSLNLDSIVDSEISFNAALTEFNGSGAPDNGGFGDDDKVHVVISTDNGATWSSDNILMTFDTANIPSISGDFYNISLAAYSGVVKIGFYAESTQYNETNDFHIDNFRWTEELNCLPVNNISVDSVFAQEAYISWSNPNAIDNFIIEYGEVGFTSGSGNQMETTDTSYVISGLDAETEYAFSIRSVCSVNDSSYWSISNTFTTACGELIEEYVQDFTGDLNCWELAAGELATTTVFTSTTLSRWEEDGYLNNGNTGSTRITILGTSVDEWLITPTLNLDSIPNSHISFLAGLTANGSSNAPYNGNFGDDDKVNIVISTDNGASWSSNNILMTFDTSNAPSHTGGYYSINLGTYSGLVRIGFYAESTIANANNDFFIDNFVWEESPTCLPIIETTIDSVLQNDAYFRLTNLNGVDNFIIEYGETGFAIGTGVTLTFVDSNVHLTGLDAITTYDVYIKNICAPGDTSVVIFPLTFTTECPIYSTTYTQNFASYIPGCWEEADGAIGTTTTFTSTTSDWRVDGFLNNEFVGAAGVNINGTTMNEWLITPSLNLDQIPNSHIGFHAGLTDQSNSGAPVTGSFGDDDKVQVVISTDNGVTWSSDNILMTFDTANTPSHLGQYYSISLGAYSGIVKIGFYVESTVLNENNDFFIDDFIWEEAPSCGQISIINLDEISSNSAILNWGNPNAAGATFILEYGIPGFTLGTGTQIISMDTTYEITGLDPITSYEIYVTTICAPGDTASWSYSIYFTTECGNSTTYFTDDFGNYLPDCWNEAEGTLDALTTFTSSTSSTWEKDGFLNSGYIGAARISIHGVSVNEWLISPTLDLDAQTYSQIEFDAGVTSHGSQNAPNSGGLAIDDKVVVVISLDNGLTWSEINTLMTFNQGNTPLSTGEHYSIPLVGYSGQVKIGFYAESTSFNNYVDFFIDNFQWSEAPSCLPTNGYDLDEVSDTSAVVTWTNVNGVSDYILEYGVLGFTLGTGTIVSATDTFINIENLTSNTDYEIYVKSVCSPTDTALYDAAFIFTTECGLVEAGYLEEFATYLPGCWSESKGQVSVNTTFTSELSLWQQDGYLNSGFTGSARINVYGAQHKEWLISPSINLNSSPKQIEFNSGLTDFSGSGVDNFGSDDRFLVVISTDNGITWSDTNVLMTFDVTNTLSNTGDHFNISLQDYSGEVKIGFYAESTVNNTDYNIYVDNFEVKEQDSVSTDINMFEATLDTLACIGESNQLLITLENSGLNPVDSFYLDVNITGGTNYSNGNVFYTQHLALGSYTPIAITDVGSFAVGTYSGVAVVSNVNDIDVKNDTLEFTFEIVELPTVEAGADTTICNGNQYQLNASGAITYTWEGGLANGDFVLPTTTTEYIVTGVNAAGCENTDTIIVNIAAGISPSIIELNGHLSSASSHTTYKWTFNGTLIGNTSQITPTASGVYTLTVTDENGCSASVDYTMEGIGVDDIKQIGLSVYPNPASGILNISGAKIITNLQILDIRGREIIQLDKFMKEQLDISELSTGYYILKGEVEGQLFQTKFTKE